MNWRDATSAVSERRVDVGVAELSDAVLNEALTHRADRTAPMPTRSVAQVTRSSGRGESPSANLLRFPWVHTRIPPRVAAAFPRPPGRAGRIDESTKDFLPTVEVDVPMQLAEFARDSDALVFGVLSLVEHDLERGTLAIVRSSAFELRASYGFMHLKDRSLSPGASAFMQAVRDEEALCVEREARLAKIYS